MSSMHSGVKQVALFSAHLCISLLGLLVSCTVGAFADLLEPFWSGGKGLFPLLFGAGALIAGGLVFELILWCLRATRDKPTNIPALVWTAFAEGVLILPVITLIGGIYYRGAGVPSLTSLPAIGLVSGVGVCALATLLVETLLKLSRR